MTKPMSKRAEKALRASIRHWEKNAAATSFLAVTTGPSYCALCNLYNVSDDAERDCRACPVQKATGELYCRKTPYAKVRYARKAGNLVAFKAAAQEEVEFLRGLLP